MIAALTSSVKQVALALIAVLATFSIAAAAALLRMSRVCANSRDALLAWLFRAVPDAPSRFYAECSLGRIAVNRIREAKMQGGNEIFASRFSWNCSHAGFSIYQACLGYVPDQKTASLFRTYSVARPIR